MRGVLLVKQEQAAATYLLKQYCTALRHPEDSPYQFAAWELIDSVARDYIFQIQSVQLGNPEPVVVGTLFAKRYSVLCMGLFGAISLFDLQLASSLEIVRFRMTQVAAMEYQTQLAVPYLLPVIDMMERAEKVTIYANRLQQHLEQIFHSISIHTGVNVQVMWSLVSNNLQNEYARIENDRSVWRTEERLRLVKADRDTLFEPRIDNKFALNLRRYQHPNVQKAPFYLRRHCCLAYRVVHNGSTEGYCNTCPKLSSEDRKRQLLDER